MNRERMSSSTMLFVWPNSHWKYLIMGQPKVEFSIWSRKHKNLHIDPTANTHRALLNVNCKEKDDWYVCFEIKCKLIWNLKSLFANFLSLLHSNLYISLSLFVQYLFGVIILYHTLYTKRVYAYISLARTLILTHPVGSILYLCESCPMIPPMIPTHFATSTFTSLGHKEGL